MAGQPQDAEQDSSQHAQLMQAAADLDTAMQQAEAGGLEKARRRVVTALGCADKCSPTTVQGVSSAAGTDQPQSSCWQTAGS